MASLIGQLLLAQLADNNSLFQCPIRLLFEAKTNLHCAKSGSFVTHSYSCASDLWTDQKHANTMTPKPFSH